MNTFCGNFISLSAPHPHKGEDAPFQALRANSLFRLEIHFKTVSGPKFSLVGHWELCGKLEVEEQQAFGENLGVWGRFCEFWPWNLGQSLQCCLGCCSPSMLGSCVWCGLWQNRSHSQAADQKSVFPLNMRNSVCSDVPSAAFCHVLLPTPTQNNNT